MKRVDIQQLELFHTLLDYSLEKLESNKNKVKPHWRNLSSNELIAMMLVEIHELKLAEIGGNNRDRNSEIDDIINLAIMYKDNLYKGLI